MHRFFARTILMITFGLLLTGEVAFFPSAVHAEAETASLIKVGEGSYGWVAKDERSANSALFVGDSIALVVDPGLTPAIAEEFLKAVRQVTNKPIRYAILTHWHPDHAMGILLSSERELTILSHRKTRRKLAEQSASLHQFLISSAKDNTEKNRLASATFRLPEPLTGDSIQIDLGGHIITITYAGPSHTEGDLIVWSKRDRVLVSGDLFLNGSCPSMGEGSVVTWIDRLKELELLKPSSVIPGHFDIARLEEMIRFRKYLQAQVAHAEKSLMKKTISKEQSAKLAIFDQFSDFKEYPQYEATFADNARVVFEELANRPAKAGETNGYSVMKVIDVGKAPHQIVFSTDGTRVFVAAAGSDKITIVDRKSFEVTGSLEAPGVPLGIAELPGGEGLAVTAFRSDHIAEIRFDGKESTRKLITGKGSSLFNGPYPGNLYLLPTEEVNKLYVFDADSFSMIAEYETGARPFPATSTSDGRKAFVPNYDDGTLTIIDLWNQEVLETIDVGSKPSGATMMPDDIELAVVVRGENRIAFVNTASHIVTHSLSEGLGESPFSIVLSPDGRFAYVNNTASNDISIISLDNMRVIARVPVGEIPIVMATDPISGDLWVGCEGSHDLYVVQPPENAKTIKDISPEIGKNNSAKTQVAVMGMIHGSHLTSKTWGLKQVADAIRAYAPDAVFAEIPPDRWERAWTDFSERGVIQEPRLKPFPEYTDLMLDLKVELGFTIEPCAAWNTEMNNLRRSRMNEFYNDPQYATQLAEYEKRNAAVEAAHLSNPIDKEDPLVIHSELYDTREKEELVPYEEYMNDVIGPGGWTNINIAHFKLIEKALDRHRGERILITFGASHKYKFIEMLKERNDIELIDLRPFLK